MAFDNHYDVVMNDVYNLVIPSKYPWPRTFTIASKITFLDNLNKYFADIADFEKCTEIQKLKVKLLKYGKKKSQTSGSNFI